MPSTAAIAHRLWISFASRYHLRNAGSLPNPSGSNPKSPGSLQSRGGGVTVSFELHFPPPPPRLCKDLRSVEPGQVDKLGVALEGRDPQLLGGDRGDGEERAAWRGLGRGGIGERAPSTEEWGIEHGSGRGGGGGRERHGRGCA
jgi:hypothetical protein